VFKDQAIAPLLFNLTDLRKISNVSPLHEFYSFVLKKTSPFFFSPGDTNCMPDKVCWSKPLERLLQKTRQAIVLQLSSSVFFFNGILC
jgi:hypothetical protein